MLYVLHETRTRKITDDLGRNGMIVSYFKLTNQNSPGMVEEIIETPVPRYTYITYWRYELGSSLNKDRTVVA
jgi:hypothetical protein